MSRERIRRRNRWNEEGWPNDNESQSRTNKSLRRDKPRVRRVRGMKSWDPEWMWQDEAIPNPSHFEDLDGDSVYLDDHYPLDYYEPKPDPCEWD